MNFDFSKYEISEEDKLFILEKEKKLKQGFKKNGEILYELCKDLYEISLKLKKENSFMEWYKSCGLSKDRVSLMLKRWSIYYEFPNKKEYISSLSELAIKYLTQKEISLDDRLVIIEKEITNAEEIRFILEPIREKNHFDFTPFKQRFFDFKKMERLKEKLPNIESKDFEQLKENLELYKKQLKELEKLIQEKEKSLENKDKTKLFESEENYGV